MKSRLPTLLIVLVAIAAGLGLVAGERWHSAGDARHPPLELQVAAVFPQPQELPEFELVGDAGRKIDLSALRGRWNLMFIGFTHCPDACPTTLATLAAAQKQLADLPPAKQPRLIFVSVDPERDSPEATDRYARHFSNDAFGATAEHAVLAPLTRSLKMVYMRVDGSDGESDYSVEHSIHVAIIDPQGRYIGLIKKAQEALAVVADLRAILMRP